MIKKNHGRGRGVSGQPENPPGYATELSSVIVLCTVFEIGIADVWITKSCWLVEDNGANAVLSLLTATS